MLQTAGPGTASQASSSSISTQTGSTSPSSGCESSPSSTIGRHFTRVSLLSSRADSTMNPSTSRLPVIGSSPSSSTSACKSAASSSAGSTIEAQSPDNGSAVDVISSTSVSSSSPCTLSDAGGVEADDTLLMGYGPVRRGPAAVISGPCRKTLPTQRRTSDEVAEHGAICHCPLTARSEYPPRINQINQQRQPQQHHQQPDTRGAGISSAKNFDPSVTGAAPSFSEIATDGAQLLRTVVTSKSLRPSGVARARYNHLENAIVFVAMASRLISNTVFCVDQQPYSVFRSEPEDPVVKQQLKRFAERLSESMRCKYPCYVLALIYLDQVTKKCASSISLSSDTFQRLVVAAIVVAAKFYDDLYFSNDHYSKELGFSLEVVNTLEVCFLVLLDFNLRVSQSDFKAVLRAFDEVRTDCCANEGGTVWCGLNTTALPTDVVSIVAAEYRITSPTGAHIVFPRQHPKHLDIDRYLASREDRGYRFESEEEFLFKSALMGRCKVIHKLIQQYHQELKRIEQEKLASLRAAKQKLPLMATPTTYNQAVYSHRQYLMLNPPTAAAAAGGAATAASASCVMQQRNYAGWNPAVSVAGGGWKRHV